MQFDTSNQSFALKDEAEIERRLGLLTLPHIQPLATYFHKLRESHLNIPNFDPCDGGVNAKLLILLEAPGPKAIKSNFVSSNNPDQTARNLNSLLEDADISRQDIILWNIVPWYLGNGKKIRKPNAQDINEALPHLEHLISKLQNLRAVVLLGKSAQSSFSKIKVTDLTIFNASHPSPQVFNVYPRKRQEAQDVFCDVAKLLSSIRAQ